MATPTRRASEETGGVALASASVPRSRVGLVWPVFSVPVSMRSLETDRSLGDFRAAGRHTSALVKRHVNETGSPWVKSLVRAKAGHRV